MAHDPRWKNPQGKDLESLWRWAQDVTTQLRAGNYLPTVISDAEGISYDNDASGLTADDVQAAIDENAAAIAALPQIVEAIAAGAIAASTTNVDIPLGSYDMVEIDLIALEPSNDGAILHARYSQDDGSNYLSGASDYAWGVTEDGAAADDFTDSEIQLSGFTGVGNGAGERATMTIRIFRPSASSFAKQMTWWGGVVSAAGNYAPVNGFAQLAANTDALTHARFFFSAGTFDAGYYAARGYRFA